MPKSYTVTPNVGVQGDVNIVKFTLKGGRGAIKIYIMCWILGSLGTRDTQTKGTPKQNPNPLKHLKLAKSLIIGSFKYMYRQIQTDR